MAARFHFGTIGGVLGLIGLGESAGDGRHDLNDIAALSAVLGAYLSRIPNSQAQVVASYFGISELSGSAKLTEDRAVLERRLEQAAEESACLPQAGWFSLDIPA